MYQQKFQDRNETIVDNLFLEEFVLLSKRKHLDIKDLICEFLCFTMVFWEKNEVQTKVWLASAWESMSSSWGKWRWRRENEEEERDGRERAGGGGRGEKMRRRRETGGREQEEEEEERKWGGGERQEGESRRRRKRERRAALGLFAGVAVGRAAVAAE